VDILSKISITCFFASYLVSFLIEISRVFVRGRAQIIGMIAFAIAGLFAQSVFIALRLFDDSQVASYGNWQNWCLIVAWILAVLYLYFAWRQPKADIGLFLLPMVLILCAAGYWLDGRSGFERDNSSGYLGILHGSSLLIGTVTVFAGFVCGVMYLMQSARLKAKTIPDSRFKLPSLEWLQTANERFLISSSVMLGGGLVSGILLNLKSTSGNSIEWTNPVVWTSMLFFVWIVSATIFNWLYKPARRGRKVAYLIVASFLFLLIELVIVLTVEHASGDQSNGPKSTVLKSVPSLSQWRWEER
jgi:ABC-type uncharacterized transport system permease subunit